MFSVSEALLQGNDHILGSACQVRFQARKTAPIYIKAPWSPFTMHVM